MGITLNLHAVSAALTALKHEFLICMAAFSSVSSRTLLSFSLQKPFESSRVLHLLLFAIEMIFFNSNSLCLMYRNAIDYNFYFLCVLFESLIVYILCL